MSESKTLRQRLKETGKCTQPDRHVAKVICGYPLPCPFHTTCADEGMSEQEVRARLACVRSWVENERGRRDNHARDLEGRGGQRVGDSHTPRMPLSCLIELECLLGARR